MNLFTPDTPKPFTHLIPFIQHTCSQVADELYFIDPPLRFCGSKVSQILLKHKCIFIEHTRGSIRLPITTRVLELG